MSETRPMTSGTSTPGVSVVMTAYNTGTRIRRTIEALLAQSYSDLELIIVDDASTDDTPEIIREYDDPRIRLYRNPENLGISRSRNRGLELARGDYVAASDHDDISYPKRLESQVRYMDGHPDVVLLGTATRVVYGDGPSRPYMGSIGGRWVIQWRLLSRSPLVHSSICMRRATLVEHGIRYRPQFKYAEDFELFNQFARVGAVECLPEELVEYHEHHSNASNNNAREMMARGRDSLEETYRHLLGRYADPSDLDSLWRCVSQGKAARSSQELQRIGNFLTRTLNAFCRRYRLSGAPLREVRREASRDWWRAVSVSATALGPGALRLFGEEAALCEAPPGAHARVRSYLKACLGRENLERLSRLRRTLGGANA